MPRTYSGLESNRIKVAEIFGVSVETVTAWVRRGCPCLQQGAKGREWKFNTADVFGWHVAQMSLTADGDAAPNFNDDRARKMAADADLAEIERDLARGRVIQTETVVGLVRREYATVRTRLSALPGAIAPQLDPERAAEFLPVIAEAVDDVLKELSADGDLAQGGDIGGEADSDAAEREEEDA